MCSLGSCCSWVFSQKRRRNCPLCSAARIWSKIGVIVPPWTSAHPSGSVSLWTSPLWGLLSAEYPFPSFFPSVISTVMVKHIFVLIAKRKEHRQRAEGRGRGKKGKRKLSPWNPPLPATPSVSVPDGLMLAVPRSAQMLEVPRIMQETAMCFSPSFNNLTALTYVLQVFSWGEKTHLW